MSTRYSVGVQSTLTAASVPFYTIKAGTGARMRLVELDIVLTSAVASDIAIARSATATTTPTIVLGQALDAADTAAVGGVAIAWATIGTANAISLARVQLPATIGAGWIWTWSAMAPLIVPAPSATGEIMLVNRGAGVCGTFNITATWEE
jgi:hypothetical protein